MARFFDRSNPDFLQVDSPAFTSGPFTVLARFRSNDDANRQTILMNGDKDVANDNWEFRLGGNEAGDPVQFRATNTGTSTVIDTTSGYSVNVWHSAAWREVSDNDRSVFLDGGSRGDSTTSVTPPNADRVTIGRAGDSTPGNGFNGDISHVAVYDVGLSNEEILSHANGVSPLRLRRNSLIHFWPVGGRSPEIDIIGGLSLTLSGSPVQSEEAPFPHQVVAGG